MPPPSRKRGASTPTPAPRTVTPTPHPPSSPLRRSPRRTPAPSPPRATRPPPSRRQQQRSPSRTIPQNFWDTIGPIFRDMPLPLPSGDQSPPPPPPPVTVTPTPPPKATPKPPPPVTVTPPPPPKVTPPPPQSTPPTARRGRRHRGTGLNWERIAQAFHEIQPPAQDQFPPPPPPPPAAPPSPPGRRTSFISPSTSPERKRARRTTQETPTAPRTPTPRPRSPSISPSDTIPVPRRRPHSREGGTGHIMEFSSPLTRSPSTPSPRQRTLPATMTSPRSLPIPTPPDIAPDSDPREIDYTVWKTSNWYVPADERPKVRKVKGSDYNYEKLKSLDVQLRTLALEQYQAGEKPLLMLEEHRFVYGLVVNIVPNRFCTNTEYRVHICDETLDSVLVRMCTSSQNREKGPEIRVGDVLRVHRVMVQQEHNTYRDGEEMVLSTSPHWNYVVFRLAVNAIEYNTCAKTITFHDDKDIPIIQGLLDLAKKRIEDGILHLVDEEEELLFQAWDGNTTTTTLPIENDPEVTLPPPRSPVASTSQPGASPVASHSRTSPGTPTFRSGTGTNMERGRGSATRRQQYTPRFHAAPPSYPT